MLGDTPDQAQQFARIVARIGPLGLRPAVIGVVVLDLAHEVGADGAIAYTDEILRAPWIEPGTGLLAEVRIGPANWVAADVVRHLAHHLQHAAHIGIVGSRPAGVARLVQDLADQLAGGDL